MQLGGPPAPLALSGPRVRWFRPATLQQLLALRERFPHYTDPQKPKYRVIVGSTQNGKLHDAIELCIKPHARTGDDVCDLTLYKD